MDCKDCQNDIPDRTIDLGCGREPLEINTPEEIAVSPTVSDLSSIDQTKINRPQSGIRFVANAVKDISVRFGKVQPGLFLTDEQSQALNKEIGVIFEDLENTMTKLIDQMKEREEQINNEVQNKLSEQAQTKYTSSLPSPCENPFGNFLTPPAALDWVNPITGSTKLKIGTCRFISGCQFCDFPGDFNIPPFPGIPTCNFTLIKDDICGAEYLNPFSTVQGVIQGFQLFFTELDQFRYAFFDLASLATGFLGRCIMRIQNCVSKTFADQDFTSALNAISAPLREQLPASNVFTSSAFVKMSVIFETVQAIIATSVSELFRFIDETLNLCDPCAAVEAITNPASLPEIPSFGGLL